MPKEATLRRPRSLQEVAEWTGSFEEFGFHTKDFLHHFQRSSSMDALGPVPHLMAGAFPEGKIADAYLAAMAVELSRSLGLAPPQWTRDPERFCREPWFASPGRHLRATLLLESPAGFRERNLFVTANALSVR